jgi:hypothetical protein
MGKHIQNIDLINAYLNNNLPNEEVIKFDNLLKTDKEFKLIYEEHITFLKGLERQELKREIKKAQRSHNRMKTLKKLLLLGVIILSAFLIYNIYFDNSKITESEFLNELNFKTKLAQTFVLKTSNEIKVKGEKGIVFSLKPKDLEHVDGRQFLGDSLQIDLLELINQQDLLMANAQTKSNDKWLVSGGAYSIKVNSLNGSVLQLKEGKTFTLSFPKHTNEPMELFYGNRNINGSMNWNSINKPLKDKKYYTKIHHTYISEVDRGGGITVIIENTDIIDAGLLSLDAIHKKYEGLKIEDLITDTLNIKFTEKEKLDDLLGENFKSRIYEVISQKEVDSLLLEQKGKQLLQKNINGFYETVKLSKFGWINVDKFINSETIKLSLKINTRLTSISLFLIDKNNNTVINAYYKEVNNIPKDRFLNILIIGRYGNQFYGLKKPFHSIEDTNLILDVEPINKNELKELFTL